MSYKKQFYKGKEAEEKSEIMLYMKVGGRDTPGMITNQPVWKKNWLDKRIPLFGTKCHARLLAIDQNLPEETVEEATAEFQDTPEEPYDRMFWVPSQCCGTCTEDDSDAKPLDTRYDGREHCDQTA